LYGTLGEVKIMTGGFHDKLMADLLSSISPATGRTASALKKWRGRFASNHDKSRLARLWTRHAE